MEIWRNSCFDYQVKRASSESQNPKETLAVQLRSPVDHFHPSNRRHCYPKAELCVFSFCFLRSLHPSVTVDLVTRTGSIISRSTIDKETSLMHIRVFCGTHMCMELRLFNRALEHIRTEGRLRANGFCDLRQLFYCTRNAAYSYQIL